MSERTTFADGTTDEAQENEDSGYGPRGQGDGYGPDDEREYEGPGNDGPPHRGRPRRTGDYRPPMWVRGIGIALIVCLVGLLLLGMVAGVLAALLFSTPPATGTSNQSYTVAGAPTVIVRAQAASVTLLPGSAGAVTMHATKSVRGISRSAAQDGLAAIQIAATQAGNTITVTETAPPVDFGAFWSDVQIDLTVPAATNLTATLDAGNLEATGIQGGADVTTHAGSITLRDAQVSNAQLHTNAGSITLTTVTLSGGATVDTNAGSIDMSGALTANSTLSMRSNAGSVSLILPGGTSAHLEAGTNVGSISVSGFPITVQDNAGAGSSASGDLAPNPSSTILLHTNAGNISVVAG